MIDSVAALASPSTAQRSACEGASPGFQLPFCCAVSGGLDAISRSNVSASFWDSFAAGPQ